MSCTTEEEAARAKRGGHPVCAGRRLPLRRQLSQVPITALGFLYVAATADVFVLAGEDARLLVYRAAAAGGLADVGDELVWTVAVFRDQDQDQDQDQPIHGLRVWQRDGRARALVWGASSVAVVDLDGVDGGREPRVLGAATAPDWIYDGAVSPWDPDRAALVTAHNDIIPLTCGGASDGLELGAATTSPSRPMLYSAQLAWLSPSCILVAAGTVFGDVVVWKCDLAAAAHTTICRLSGHEGSVYGVDISPALTLPDGTTMRLLASCSDDRTIRIWDVSDAETSGPTSAQPSATTETTGFRSSSPSCDDGAADRLVAVAMGHLSRIWGVKLGLAEPATLPDGTLCVYSFGEDATAQRWRLSLHPRRNGGDGALAGLAHEQAMSLHNGKHLWAGAVLCRPGTTTLLATGGGDGKICLVREPMTPVRPYPKHASSVSRDGVVTVDVQDILASLPRPPPSRSGRDIINRYDFLSADQILVSTTLGRLFVGSLIDGLAWEEIEVDDDVAGDVGLTYALRAVGNGAAVLGTTNGHILYFQRPRRLSRVVKVPGKVVDVGCVSAAPGRGAVDTSWVEIMVHLHGNPSSQYLTLDAPTGRVLRHEHTAGLDARFVAISAARMGDVLLMGSRHGWLSLLTRQEDAWRPVLDLAPRSRDGITAIVPLPPKANATLPSPYFVATSRDGKFRIYRVEWEGDGARCHLLHETSPPFGPMVEGAWFTRDAVPELILYGFRSKNFVIWNETRREEVATIDCGGAHRTFRPWFSASDPGHYRFAFTRTSKLAISSQARPIFRTLKAGTHGREIRALSSNGRYIASGAEDTSIRIWTCVSGRGQSRVRICHLASVKAHVTGIQQLRWAGDEYLFSSAGNEEFFVWRVRSLDSSYAGLAVVCEAVYSDKSATGDLRIMDFDVDGRSLSSGLLVTLAFSNSTFRTYQYGPDGGFKPLAHGVYTGACVTQVRHLGMCRDRLWVVTASTDGHMALWATQAQGNDQEGPTYVMTQAAQVHQSSIKGLDMTRQGQGYLIMTGGDDNALGVSAIGLAEDGSGHVIMRRGVVRSAHAAAINGVVWLAGEEGAVGVSVSNDQRVRAWRVCGTRVELVGSMCSGVADPGDVAQVCLGSVMVGGVGVEVWSWLDGKRSLSC
ncbi:WD domain, G-beta repeat domain-containing protein [Hirsutella rhossiliensis]|uniref:WD domain, g-beta repeat domain-containing protein n=1 Tax=Hirsutella rhossiliensis TaxID=111463 RepID=A0A9P8MUL2_9HYPO|nr:WD domain, g-beta repeat domain-containing protein [Hirsutella rhossiliensis]KAH0962438.1 WD domain, g-beta repeat domain-containing protein [Hirsutella rhossiliensis]